MWQFILFIRDCIARITNLLEGVSFDFAGINVSFFDLIIGFLVLGFVISVFWKGART